MAQHRYSTDEIYRAVVADVVDRVRGEFLADGVAESVLDDLRTRWETKLAAGGGGGAGPPDPAVPSAVGAPAVTAAALHAGGGVEPPLPAYLAPLPLPLNPLPEPAGDEGAGDGAGDGDGPPTRAKRARRASGGLPQVDGPAAGGEEGPAGGGEGEEGEARDDFADVPTSSDDEDGAGGRGGPGDVSTRDGGAAGEDGGGSASAGDVLLCTFDKVVRTRNRWRCVLRRAVLRLGGVEHFFDSLAGDMTF